MLLQFAVTNYRSFRDTAVLSLVPAPGVPHTPGQLVRTGLPTLPEVLRAAVVYGPNASGKSNLVKALGELRALLHAGDVSRGSSRPFRLAEVGATSRFEIELALDGRHFSYGIEVGASGVVEEWLAEVDGGELRPFFHRREGEDWRDEVRVEGADPAGARALAATVPRDRVFCHVAGAAGIEPMASLQRWPRTRTLFEFTNPAATTAFLLGVADVRAHAEELLSEAGAGEVEVRFVIEERGEADIRGILARHGISSGQPLSGEVAKAVCKDGVPAEHVSARLVRRRADGTEVVFRLDEESDGTRRLLDLAPWHFGSSRQGRALAVIDEIERSLHPLIVQSLVARLMGSEGQAQLVCATHDSNLLNLRLLPHDSIWFMQKGPDGASRLYSLAEFKPEELARLESRMEEGYLEGRFGAIPFLGDAARLGWTRAG